MAKVSGEVVRAARRAGRHAALTGRPVTACPWLVSDTPHGRALLLVWVRGWLSAAPDVRVSYE